MFVIISDHCPHCFRKVIIISEIQLQYLDAGKLGIDTVLTSGAAASCLLGMDTIGQFLKLRDEMGGPEVLIGAGVNAGGIGQFRSKYPQARAFHMSGKTDVESGMRFRREGVPMGLPGLDEWHIQQTDEAAVRRLRKILDTLHIHKNDDNTK